MEHQPQEFLSLPELEKRIAALELAVFAPHVDPVAVENAKIAAVALAAQKKANKLQAAADEAQSSAETTTRGKRAARLAADEAQEAADKSQAKADRALDKVAA